MSSKFTWPTPGGGVRRGEEFVHRELPLALGDGRRLRRVLLHFE